ncbi:MAG TPA: SDR family NAD(P)-dependent oxidoreductase [Mucilaginibacter sp.]|jgi:NAD(P)-dependent dehydrogenase (short-subunit alcohol dehydrogenase family)
MKTAFITGANKGIGFETAKQLLAAGYYVYLGSRDIEKGAEAVMELNSDDVEAIQIDVSNEESIGEARGTIGSKAASLDALINNAGTKEDFPDNPTAINTDVIRRVFDTNFFGAINVTMAFLDLLKAAPEPRIVNVTSGLASLTLHNDPSWKYYHLKRAAYGPSKTALNAYTIALAFELRDSSFKINVVDPGFTATDFNQYRGTGSVADAGKIIVKYATLDADGPTGKFFSNESESENQEYPW